MEKVALLAFIQKEFGEEIITESDSSLDFLTIEVAAENSYRLIEWLKNNQELPFHFLTDVCGAHFPTNSAERQFCVIYHLHNWVLNVRIRVKVFLAKDNLQIDSIVPLFASANWQERETYDFYGIDFINHPDLRRILNMDEMVDFPLRKEYPMEDQFRTDKDDRYFGRIPQNLN